MEVWSFTCVGRDMPGHFALLYRTQATQGPGKVAAVVEERKEEKYHCLLPSHYFSPVAIETMGALGSRSMALLRDIGHRITEETGESHARDFIFQQLSVAVQRGNCASVLGWTTI